jgi:hypothetical protein
MPKELFDQPNQCHPILPYEPVTNRLYFFRVTVFDMKLPEVNFKDSVPKDVVWPPPVDKWRDPDWFRLGIPVSDLFPEILPEAPAGTYTGKEDMLRVGSNRMVLPADSVNDKYTNASNETVTIDKDGVKVPDHVKHIFDDLDPHDLDLLKSGRVITRVKGKELVRLALAPARAPRASTSAHPQSRAQRWNIPLNPNLVSDSDFLEVMKLLYEDVASDTYRMLAIASFLFADAEVYRGIIQRYSTDTRGEAYLLAFNQQGGNTKNPVPSDPESVSDSDYVEIMWMLYRRVPSDKYLSLPRPDSPSWDDIERGVRLAVKYYQDPRRKTLWETSQMAGDSPGEDVPPPSDEEGCQSAYPTYEIGLLTQYEQEWTLTGYSRGALVSALTLAPNEEMVLEVFTWDRTKVEEQRETTTEYERNVDASSLTKVSGQISRDLSETTDRSAGIGLGATLPVQGIPVKVEGNADVSNTLNEGMQTSVESIAEATTRASERFKTTNQVKVVQTRETGREERVTRRIRNPNLGRTLTLNCFEVIENYSVKTGAKVGEPFFVLLVDFPRPPKFDIDFILAYQDKLQRALLSTVYRGGFDAAKKILAQRYFDERSLIKVEIDASRNNGGGESTPPAETAPAPPIVTLAKSLRNKLKKLLELDLVKEVFKLAESYKPFGEPVKNSEKADAEAALGRFNFWIKFKVVTPGVDSLAKEFVDNLSSGDITPQSAYEALSAFVPGLDDEWVTSLKMIAANIVAVHLGATLIIPFPWLLPVMLELAIIEDNMGIPKLIEKAKKEVRNYEMTMGIPGAAATGAPAAGAPAVAPPLPPPPPQLYTLAAQAEAEAEFRKFQLHLEANAVYYMNFIIAQEDANVRYEKLKVMGIQNYVENRLLGFVGRKAIFPLVMNSIGSKAKTYIESKLLAGWHSKDGDLHVPPVTETTIQVALPTGGLYMEASMGQCDALEPFLAASRDVELASARAQVALAEERVKQMAIENQRRQMKLDNGDLDPA